MQTTSQQEMEQAKEENFQECNQKQTIEDWSTPERPIRLYADGVYDMFHMGHVRQLQQCKEKFKYVHLMVGVTGDEDTIKYKGKTIMNAEERSSMVMSCRFVDEVICPCPWFADLQFLDEKRIDYICHDDIPYVTGDCDDVYQVAKKNGRFLATQRTEGISTSDIVLRIVKDYDQYVMRNLKRGYKREELGISFLKEKQIQFKEKYNNFKQKASEKIPSPVKKTGSTIVKAKEKFKSAVNKLGTKSEDLIFGFLCTIDKRISETKNKFLKRLKKKNNEEAHGIKSFSDPE